MLPLHEILVGGDREFPALIPDWSAATMTSADQGYAFGNSFAGQRDRLRTLEAVLDGGTFRRLAECGVGPGWRCLEVGAGARSVANWLADRVGLDGSVLATDLDTTLLDDFVRPSLAVRLHNVMTDPLPEASFNLVHARLLLAWLPDPAVGLRRLVAALKPGGWLVVEDLDFASTVPDPDMELESAALVARVLDAYTAVLAQRSGFDPAFGRRLRGLLEDAALLDVDEGPFKAASLARHWIITSLAARRRCTRSFAVRAGAPGR